MRQSRAIFALLSLLLLSTGLLLVACGGGGNNPVAINVTPSPASMAFGQTVQLNAQAVNSGGAVVQGATFTYASSNGSIQVSPNGGAICAGHWDSNFINCCPGTWNSNYTACSPLINLHAAQFATITVSSGNLTPQPVQVFVHVGVDTVQFVSSPGVPAIPPTCTSAACTSPSCTSVGQTSTAFLAEATSNNSTYCNAAPTSTAAPCTIPSLELLGNNSSLTISPFQWTSDDATIASTTDVVTGATSPTVLATGPGKANIIVSTANGNSGSVTASFPFYTCPITSISVTPTSLSPFTSGSAQTLTATLVDSNNFTIPYPQSKPVTVPFPNLNWISTNPYMATVAVISNTSATEPASNGVTLTKSVPTNQATATGVTDGNGALLASCTPPNCNKNLFPVYSAPLAASISGGTATSGLWIASTQSQNITSLAAGTSIAAGAKANSFMMNQPGTFGLIGTSTGTLVLNALTGGLSLIQFAAVPQPSVISPGTTIPPILKISPDGAFGAVVGRPVGQTGNWIGGINLTTNQLFTFPVVGTVTGADFTPDSQYLWVTTTETSGATPNHLYTYQINGATSGASSMNLPNTGVSAKLDVAFLSNGPLGYVTNASTVVNNVTAYATCFGTPLTHIAADDTLTTTNAQLPTNVRALPDGSGVAVFNSPYIDVLKPPSPTLSGTFACLTPIQANTFTGGSHTSASVTSAPVASDLNQFLITPDGTKAVFTSQTSNNVIVFTLPNGPAVSVPLVSGTLNNSPRGGFKGAISADSLDFFVGANDGNVHMIDLTGATCVAPNTPNVPCDSIYQSSSALVSAGLTQADGVTAALPEYVVIRNQ